jgi:hypothetical protein
MVDENLDQVYEDKVVIPEALRELQFESSVCELEVFG